MKRADEHQTSLDFGPPADAGEAEMGPAAPGPVSEPTKRGASAAEAEDELPDREARDRIETDLDTNLLVEAGAGSGKTTALVRRMVALVRTGAAEVEAIAAVTFTRKAAGELRERFQEALENARVDPGVTTDERARLERAVQGVERAFMGTIHAFCARLLRERPLEAGVDPAFGETTAAEATLLADRYWGLHLERLANEGDPSLGELDAVGLAPARLRGLYDELREYPDVAFPADPVAPPEAAAVARVRASLEGILDDAAGLLPRTEPEKGWDTLQARLRSLRYVRWIEPWDDDRVFLDALGDLCSRSEWSITQYKWSSTRAGKAAAKALCQRVSDLTSGEAGRLMETWYAHRYPIALRFARAAADGLEAWRRARGSLDFQDLLALAAKLLRGNPRARRDLGERYRRLLVDEFQDTDPLQAEVVCLLASEPDEDAGAAVDWMAAVPRPGALFVVGDPKQSIYRFRRADIALYKRVRDRFEAFGGVVELVANFRSGPPVARLVNEVLGGDAGFPAEASEAQAAFAPLLPQPRTAPPREGVFHYAVEAGGSTGWQDLAAADAEALATFIAERCGADRAPGDFLVLTSQKKHLERYARALEARNLPVQISGAGVGVEEELAELRLLLEALTDPDDPTRVVAVLLGLFFGLDHEHLLRHREAGRGFDYRLARDEDDGDAVEAAMLRLRGWWEMARLTPADVVIERIADDLALLPYAASGELGGLRAGSLAFALDAVRRAGLDGDTSLAGALEILAVALAEDEAEAPLEPGRSDVVRLMNLHKAKGLEAPVVVLAAPFGAWEPPVKHVIERAPDGSARGWLAIHESTGRWSSRPVARPHGWEEKAAREAGFRAAEQVRLLYVAATRAGEELVVARAPDQPDKSPWRAFEPWLGRNGEALAMVAAARPEREVLSVTAADMAAREAEAVQRLRAAGEEGFRFVSVTGLVKGPPAAGSPPPVDLASLPSPASPAAPAPGGFEWGSAVHGVLEAAARGASGARLHAVARALLLELDRPTRGGEPTELDALVRMVEAVLASTLWARAAAAARRLAEVPFALSWDEGGDDAPPTWLEGVIDLAFREPDGWVLVDYKTDVGSDPDFPARRLAYREQLATYGHAWERLTGERVKERLLLWTRSGQVEAIG